jgi:tetrapyrrole methylase family protein / MazG family protein
MEEFTKLVELMEALRSEQGCAWDKKQTEKSFRTFLLEEVYEVIEAIDKDDYHGLKEELGDLLFHIVFLAQISKEAGRFDIRDVVTGAHDKMFRRHPHVFACDAEEKPVEKRWEEIKKAEKAGYSPVSHVPKMLPALLRSYVISRRAAKVGFDWEKIEDIYEKMYEEIEELKNAEALGNTSEIEEEVGDLLFTVANISRYHGIDPETALRRTTEKFIRRFAYIEPHLDSVKGDLGAMDALWNEIKNKERKGK